MPEITADDIARIVKDALYVTVGAGLIGVQKAQVRRRELTKALTGQLTEARERLDGIEDRVGAIEDRYEALLDQIETRLPEQAKDLFKQSRDAAKDARTQVRSRISFAA